MKRLDRAVRYRIKAASRFLPPAVQGRLVRRRHLKHVSINMEHLTPRPFLGEPTSGAVDWIDPTGLPELPRHGLEEEPLNPDEAREVLDWIAATNLDSDAMLERRLDNHGDELGRVRAALRTRVAISLINQTTPRPGVDDGAVPGGDRVLFDARSLQSAAFGQRGIGRFAATALAGLRSTVPDDRLDLLIDSALEELPIELAGSCSQVRWVDSVDAPGYGLVIQPSPMTASAAPLLKVLAEPIRKVALVFDFIPLHYPDVYLAKAPMRAEYLARLDALRLFTDFICISNLVADEVVKRLAVPISATSVAWPRSVHEQATSLLHSSGQSDAQKSAQGPIVILTGDEARKNTFGALAAAGAATTDQDSRDILVLGMAGQGTRVHHWSIAAMMRPGEAITLDRISDEEMATVLQRASIAVVASFDEGLSLPVIEAVHAGVPVIASDIPAHRELIGAGNYLASPRNIEELTRAMRRYGRRTELAAHQSQRLRGHRHEILEDVIARFVEATDFCPNRPPLHRAPSHEERAAVPLRVAILTPWPPQKTGIADFTAAIAHELAQVCDLTIVTTSDAQVESGLKCASVDSVFANPEGFRQQFDSFIVVIGNSHFHLPYLEALGVLDAVVVAHDTRMTEVYMALRASHGVIDLMTRGQQSKVIAPSLDDQIDDMRLLQNTAMWEVARQAHTLVMHSPSAAPQIERETRVPVTVLPFVNYRFPPGSSITADDRAAARQRLGLSEKLIHLATFGYVDRRTKLTDLSLEVAGWLQDWGFRVHFHIVGSASEDDSEQLSARAQALDLGGFTLTGYASEDVYRDYLLAIDCGLQLRVSPLLGVSGPLADLAAFGTPAVASRGLYIDVGSPANVHPLPDYVSPVTAAQAIEALLRDYPSEELRESRRLAYLEAMSPRVYVQEFMTVLESAAKGNSR